VYFCGESENIQIRIIDKSNKGNKQGSRDFDSSFGQKAVAAAAAANPAIFTLVTAHAN
jgi:hypothetical protein